MKRMNAMLLVCSGLVACAQTPREVEESGIRTTHNSTLTPPALARCIARNAENVSGSVIAQERAEPDGSQEVIVRSGGEGVNTLAVVRVTAVNGGSNAVISVTNHALAPEVLRSRLTSGC